MSAVMEEETKRWRARRKSAMVLEIIQGKTTVSEASRRFNLTPSEIESWVDDGKNKMENALRAMPEDVRDQYERQLKDLQETYGQAMLELRAQKKIALRGGQGRHLMAATQRGLRDEGFEVSMVKRCRWFGAARRTMYYRPPKAPAVVDPALAAPNKALIEIRALVRVPQRGRAAGHEQEHGAGDLPAQGLAGAQACGRTRASQSRHRVRWRRHRMRVGPRACAGSGAGALAG